MLDAAENLRSQKSAPTCSDSFCPQWSFANLMHARRAYRQFSQRIRYIPRYLRKSKSAAIAALLLFLVACFVRIPQGPWTARISEQEVERMIQSRLQLNQTLLSTVGQHIFSAYFDTRSTLGARKVVRLITVSDTKAYPYQNQLRCQFLDDSGHFSFSTLARRSAIGAGMDHGDHYYQEFVLSCPIFNDLRLATFVFVQSQNATMRSQVLRVRHNPVSLGQKPQFPQKIINCVSVTFGRPSEHRLIEWLEAQRLLKVEKVVLHLHHVLSKEFKKVAQAYSDEGFVDIRPISCPFCVPGKEDQLGLLLMSPAINQCFYENLGRYAHTAVFDLDDIIVPLQHPDLPTMLSALHLRANTSSFAFRNWYHFVELGEDPKADVRMAMLRHPFRTKQPSLEDCSTKSIHRSCCVVALHNHFSWEDVPQPNTQSRCWHVDLGLGLNEHYKECHFSEKECKRLANQSDQSDGSRLRQMMGKQLTEAFQTKVKKLLQKPQR